MNMTLAYYFFYFFFLSHRQKNSRPSKKKKRNGSLLWQTLRPPARKKLRKITLLLVFFFSGTRLPMAGLGFYNVCLSSLIQPYGTSSIYTECIIILYYTCTTSSSITLRGRHCGCQNGSRWEIRNKRLQPNTQDREKINKNPWLTSQRKEIFSRRQVNNCGHNCGEHIGKSVSISLRFRGEKRFV
jgi:hypothetical protein